MNIFDITKNASNEEIIDVLLKSENIRIEKIISNGQSSPEGFWYDQAENEWLVLLQGNAEILFSDNDSVILNTGDTLFIEAHRKHRVEKTSVLPDCIWLCVFEKIQ